jgi:hypothetical protein
MIPIEELFSDFCINELNKDPQKSKEREKKETEEAKSPSSPGLK